MAGIAITNEGLERIFRASARRLISLAAEGEDDLLEVIHRKAAAAQEKKSEKLSVTFTHRITVDFVKGTQRDTLGAPMKVEIECEGELDDPDQAVLFGDDEAELEG